jgi:hypothetical protein
MVPRAALVYYEHSDPTKRATTVELYDVRGAQLFNPRPLSEKNIEQFVQVFGQENKQKRAAVLCGVIPENTLYVKDNRMVFIIPAQEHTLFFGNGPEAQKKQVFLPIMMFDYAGPYHSINVYWSKGDKNDILAGEGCLIGAPMPNISNGHLCVGSSMKRFPYISDMSNMQQRVIKGFFGSTFNEWRDETIAPIMHYCMKLVGDKAGQQKFWAKKRCPALDTLTTAKQWRKLKF